MFDATSPSDPDLGSRIHGCAEIGFSRADGRTRLAHLYHHDPLRVLFPTPPADDIVQAALVTTSGGMVGGDRLTVAVEAGVATQAMVTPQAAEKVYRSTGADCAIDVTLRAAEASWLEWLPQETILFDGARLRRSTRIEVAGDARVLAGEMLVFGRIGRGERFTAGFLRDAWDIRRDGVLVWADALRLDDDIARTIDHPAGLDGATIAATAVYVAPDAAALRETAREILDDQAGDLRCGVSVVNGVLIARWLGRDARRVRASYGSFWQKFRARAAGLPARLPRLWHV